MARAMYAFSPLQRAAVLEIAEHIGCVAGGTLDRFHRTQLIAHGVILPRRQPGRDGVAAVPAGEIVSRRSMAVIIRFG